MQQIIIRARMNKLAQDHGRRLSPRELTMIEQEEGSWNPLKHDPTDIDRPLLTETKNPTANATVGALLGGMGGAVLGNRLMGQGTDAGAAGTAVGGLAGAAGLGGLLYHLAKKKNQALQDQASQTHEGATVREGAINQLVAGMPKEASIRGRTHIGSEETLEKLIKRAKKAKTL